MIKIFDAKDTDFSTAGNIIIEPIKCIEIKRKSLNGWYLEVEIPIKYKEYISKDKLCVVKTKSKLNPQAFRIGENIEYSTSKIKFIAEHVMFDAKDYILVDVRPTNLNGSNALNYINKRTDELSPFNISSNVENVNTAYFIRKNLLEAWTTIEERWNGIFDADNWNINFLNSVGNDNGETITYGKNMQGFDIYEDWSSVCTKIYPVGYDGIMLPEQFLESDVKYDKPYTRVIDFETDLEIEEQTEENLILELRANAEAHLEENKVPKVSYTIISNINETLEIGDTIKVLHPFVNIFTEVLEYEYNLISKKIKSLTFGNYSRNVKAKFNNIKNTIEQINQALSKQEVVINTQTNLINTLNKNGYVYIDDNEILILDALPKEKAKNVWRFGLGGIGFSSNGYEGPFETAITMDGQINADFITVGTIATNRIEGLSDLILEVSKKVDLTTSAESIYGKVNLDRINEGVPIYIHIYPIEKNISYLYPRDNLYPSDDLFPTIRTLRFTNTITNEYIDYELPTDLLYYNSENYDEFILDYDSQSVVVNKRVGYNADGTTYVLENPTTLEFDFPNIALTNGNYTVELLTYETAYLFVRLMVQNIYTTQFATKAEVKTQINQTSQSINLSVDKKLENYPTNTEMNSAINIEANKITSNVSETYSTKTETINAKQEAIDSANESTDNKLINYSTTTEMNSAITQKANEINLEVSKKVDNEEFTGANIMLAINDDSSTASINADKINIDGKAVNFETDIEETIGTYTADDLERVRQIILGNITPTSEDYEKYDITGDGYISTLDYTYIGRAVSNGGTYTFSGKFKIDPYSAETSIGIYNNATKRYTALLSLMGGEFNNLYANNIQTNFGENGERSSLSSTGLFINGSYLNDENLGSISAQVGSWYNNIQTSGIMIISPEKENGNVNTIDIVAQADDTFISINGNNILVPVTLYESSEGTTGTVTLSESVDEYKKIEILVSDIGGHGTWKTFTVLDPNYQYVTTDIISINGSDYTNPRINLRKLYISGTTITVESASVNYLLGGTYEVNEQKIYKVIGYK